LARPRVAVRAGVPPGGRHTRFSPRPALWAGRSEAPGAAPWHPPDSTAGQTRAGQIKWRSCRPSGSAEKRALPAESFLPVSRPPRHEAPEARRFPLERGTSDRTTRWPDHSLALKLLRGGLPGEVHGILLDRWREETQAVGRRPATALWGSVAWAELVCRCFTFRDQSRRANLLDRGKRSRTAIFGSIKRRSSDQS